MANDYYKNVAASQLWQLRGARRFEFLFLLCVVYNSCLVGSAFTWQSYESQIMRRHEHSLLFAKGSRSSKATPKMPNISAFSSESKPPNSSTMVVLDVENIRGANAFRISHEALITRIRLWREDRLSKGPSAILEPMICVCDHGATPSVHHFSPNDTGIHYNGVDVKMPNNFGVAFAGLRTADDVIVDLVQLRCGDGQQSISRNTTIVITADAKLISRCQIVRRESSSLSDLIFVEPSSLLQQLEVYKLNPHEETFLFGELHQSTSHSVHRANTMGGDQRRIDGKTNTMTSFKESSVALEQHARFQARFKNAGGPKMGVNSSQTDTQQNDKDVADSELDMSNKSSYAASIAAKLKTEQIRRQMLLSDAFYLARPSKMRGRRSASTMAAIHAKYKDRNISKKQQKRLYKKRFGRQRNEEMVKAATTRKELATKLQMHLERLADCEHAIGQCRYTRADSEYLLHTLLGWFEEEHCERRSRSHHDKLGGLPMHFSEENDADNLESDGSYNPLGSIVRAPLRDSPAESPLAPLRLVVISDTHGFEGALAKFDLSQKHNHHYLLPKADLLIHCGKFIIGADCPHLRAPTNIFLDRSKATLLQVVAERINAQLLVV